jgi:hypothetical protein
VWRVLGKDGREALISRQSSFTESTGTQDYGALAAAMSRTVVSLSREVAPVITALSQQASSKTAG